MSIRLENVNYTYMPKTVFEKHALRDINLEIREGELVGIIGHTGSGKSTLMQQFNGLIRPQTGEVYVDGERMTRKNVVELRKKVGYVFQYPEHQLFEDTVYKDIIFGLKRFRLSEEEIKSRVNRARELLRIPESMLEKSVYELSGGEKRRVAICGVIVSQPEYLVLDEPASGLDPVGKNEMLEMLRDINETGATVVFISHSMDDVAETARRVLVMDQGRIVKDGTVPEVFSCVEELRAMGLDVPEVTKIFTELAEKHGFVSKNIFTVREAEEELLRLKNEGRLRL